MATITLLGLENDLATELSRILRQHEHNVKITDSIETVVFQRDVDIVFAGGDGPDYRDIVRQLTARRPGLRVVLVNRLPENYRWLDALELGAADYCGAPFEPIHMRWLVDSVMRQPIAA
jgi:DNA-binding response OmpR family regulator